MASLIIALDRPDAASAIDLVDRLGEHADYYKVGAELFTAAGPSVVESLRARGKRVFLDLKYHDIPNTVASAIRSAAALGVDLLTVHASGGEAMLRAAAEAAAPSRTTVVAVTLLTSLSPAEVSRAWGKPVETLREDVDRLADLAIECGLAGVVASPLEVAGIKRRHGTRCIVVTPGVRPAGAPADDQTRTATAGDAARAGADYLVVGRPVHAATDPVAAIRSLRGELPVSSAT